MTRASQRPWRGQGRARWRWETDGRTAREREVQVTGIGARRGRRWGAVRWGKGHNAAAKERAVGEEARTNEQSRCCVVRQANKDERAGIRFFSISERDGACSRGSACPCPDRSHEQTPYTNNYVNLILRCLVHLSFTRESIFVGSESKFITEIESF
jgi:hypothetical protein